MKWYRVTYSMTITVDVIADDEAEAKYYAEYEDEIHELINIGVDNRQVINV